VHAEDSKITAEEALELLDRQNEDLASRKWVVVKDSDSMNAKSSHFAAMIGYQPLKALRAPNFKPY
jgi:hypothetical protein